MSEQPTGRRAGGDETTGDPPTGDVMPVTRVDEGGAISPRMTAVFGALFGLAAVAGIFALLIQVFPVRDEPRTASLATTAEATAVASATAPPGPKKRVRVPLPGPWRLSALEKDGGVRIVKGTMNRRSFIVALGEASVPKAEVYRILRSMEEVRKFDRCGRKDTFAVAMTRGTNKVVAFEYEVNPVEIYQARADKAGLLRSERLDMKVRSEEYVSAFYVGPDIQQSYRHVGLEDGVLQAINKAFNGRTSTEAFEEGGVVRLILSEQTALGAFVRYEHVKALEFRPADPSGKPLRAYFFEGEQFRGYVDEKGRAPSAKGWRSPVPGAPITSHFNLKRMHPILKRIRPHNGTDYGAPAGTPIYAAYRGEVESASFAGGFGNLVVIHHPGGVSTYYAHMSRFASGLKQGMRVGTRQLIGYVGSTGRSTGPHLHFGAKKNGKWFNAIKLNMDAWRPIPAPERAAFLTVKRQLDGRLEAIPMPEPPPEPPPEAPAASPDTDGSPANTAAPEAEPAPPSERYDEGPPSSSSSDLELLGEDLSVDPE